MTRAPANSPGGPDGAASSQLDTQVTVTSASLAGAAATASTTPATAPVVEGGWKPLLAVNDDRVGLTVAGAINGLLAHQGNRIATGDTFRLAIATAYFNPGGFDLLADQLERVDQVRILLGADPAESDARTLERIANPRPGTGRRRRARAVDPSVARALEGHTRSLTEDRDLLGFTRSDDASARRLVAFLRDHPGVEVRRYERGFLHGKAFLITTDAAGVISGSSNFTRAGLSRNRELNLGNYAPETVREVTAWFDEQWNDASVYPLADLYAARWAPHQPWDVFLRMLYEMYGEDLDADDAATSSLGLTQFQADGVWRAKRILARRGGVVIADEVGLGKTFIAGELIHDAIYERRQKVLLVAPATLRDTTWRKFLRDFNLRADCISFEELVASIDSAGQSASALQHLDEYAMVIVDEAHNLRNDRTMRADAMRRVLAGRFPKQLVGLTATPINNSLLDLYNFITLFTLNDAAFADIGIPSLREYFLSAQAMNPDDLSPEHLFDVLDAVAVRRTRRFVKNHYVGDTIRLNGVEVPITFPTPRVVRVDYDLNDVLPGVFADLALALGGHTTDDDRDGHDSLDAALAGGVILTEPGTVLTMARYVPSQFRRDGATETYEAQNAGLLRSGLLKRFESSSYAFEKTVRRMVASHDAFLRALDGGLVLTGDALRDYAASDSDSLAGFFTDADSNEHVAPAAEYRVIDLRAAVEADRELLDAFASRVSVLHSGPDAHDPKVAALVDELARIAKDANDEGIGDAYGASARDKRKALIFTYFADTAEYLDQALTAAINADDRLAVFRGRTDLVTGPDRTSRLNAIVGLAPQTAGTGEEPDTTDLLVATDVLAEGINLQQARHIINYDLPWNPMRLVQRHGRVDRIGSPHAEIFLRCFFPDADLDAILGLEERLQRKIKRAAVMGVGSILPGQDPVERVLTETRDRIAQLRAEEATLFEDEGGGALSGEDFRRRLATALSVDSTRQRVLALPWGSGTGFKREGADHGFVFCARIAGHNKPWFRYVPMDAAADGTLTVRMVLPLARDQRADTTAVSETAGEAETTSLVPEVIEETLSCLDQADPGTADTPWHLPEATYSAAFDAWAAASAHIYDAWTRNTDPANLAPQVPRVMRDAAALVEEHGAVLGAAQDTLTARLNAPYATRIQREIRAMLTDTTTAGVQSNQDKVHALRQAADRLGLTPPPPPLLLPPIDPADIHLVCWTAIGPPT